jgi:hypothetical protein
MDADNPPPKIVMKAKVFLYKTRLEKSFGFGIR